MSSNRYLILALSLLLLGASLSKAATLDEAASKELEYQNAKRDADIDDVRRKGSSPSAANGQAATHASPSSSVDDDDFRLAGVYGLGDELRADLIYKGASITLSKQNPQFGSWRLVAIEPNAIKIAKGKGPVRTILVSATVGQQAGGMSPGQPWGGSLPALPAVR